MTQSTPPAITVGLVQIGELTWARRDKKQWRMVNGVPVLKPPRQSNGKFVYLPYSVGLLQAYVQAHAPDPSRYRFLPQIFKPAAVGEAVAQLESADIVGFSAYVWNAQQSLAIARRLKEVKPNIVIVFGGPQVPDQPETFLRENRFIDLVCHGEGERAFAEILRRLPDCDWTAVPSISYLNADDQVVSHLHAPRISDLSTIPSPYLSGVFDDLIAQNEEYRWLVMWETNRGCPFSCTFCDWGSATAAKVYRFDMGRLKEEMEWFAQRHIEHVFFCDANFGIFPRDIEIAQYFVDVSRRHRHFMVISVQNTKNATERSYEVQKTFAQITTAGVTLSMQSLDPATLQAIRRDNISLESFLDLQQRYKRDGILTYTDLILGLPAETYDTFTDGVSRLIKYGQHNRIAFYNCSILPNAEMAHPTYRAEYGIASRPVEIIHGYEELEQTAQKDVKEYLENVVYTAAMPPDDWLRAKVFTWMVELLHFNRLFQTVFVLLVEKYGVTYRELIETIMDADSRYYPTVAGVYAQMLGFARLNQAGEPEYVPSQEYLGIWWPAYEYIFIDLATRGKLDALYAEVEELLHMYLAQTGRRIDPRLLHQAIMFNKALVRLPLQMTDTTVALSYNLWEFCRGVLEGEPVALKPERSIYYIDRTSTMWLTWDAWYEDVIMRSYRRSDFLYEPRRISHNTAQQPAQTSVEVSAD